MERYSYLWGTQGKNYAELGRSLKLEGMLRNLGTTNPELALDEVRQMFFGFHILPGYADQKTPPLAVRYAPVYLNKKAYYALKQMEPFAAICVNGLENSSSERESVYSYLTLLNKDELVAQEEYSLPEMLFGGRLLSMEDEEQHKLGNRKLNFEEETGPVEIPSLSGRDKKEDRKICIRTIWELFKGADHRVVIRLEKDAPFMERSMLLLRSIYSLLPARMGAETGFSVYERPENIKECIDKLNTRIFILPAEAVVDPDRHLPESTAFIDRGEFLFKPEAASDKEAAGDPEQEAESSKSADQLGEKPSDTAAMDPQSSDYRDVLLAKLAVYMRAGDGGPSPEMEQLLTKWCLLPWEKRKPVMDAVFTDDASYLDKDAFFVRVEAFFNNAFLKWEREPKIPFSFGDDTESLVKETVALYKEYRSFPICRAIAWAKDAFAAQLPAILSQGHTLPMLKSAVEQYNMRNMTSDAHRKCEAYIAWLSDMERRLEKQRNITQEALDEAEG